MRSKSLLLTLLTLVSILTAGCATIGPQPTPVAPTKTPKPTFTATPDWTPTPVVFATVTPAAAAPTAEAAAPAQPEATAEPAATEPATATPNPVARLSSSQTVNVRSGPGTNYPVIGRLSAGQAFDITGKSPRGDWYQFDLNGRPAWVIGNLVSVSGDADTVQVAQNIPQPPAAPTARPQPRPQPTTRPAAPQPTAVPQPTTPYVYAQGSMLTAPNCGTVYIRGKVVDSGGNVLNAITIELEFFGNKVYRMSGVGESTGEWGFSPLSPDSYKSSIPFRLRVVESESNPTPLSPDFNVSFQNCDQAGQFFNITFKKVQ